jgi:hypothetical protein
MICDSVMGPTVFNTAKMRRDELGGGIMLTEARSRSYKKASTRKQSHISLTLAYSFLHFVIVFCANYGLS